MAKATLPDLLGDTVLYTISSADAELIKEDHGYAIARTNVVRAGDVYPAVVVRTFDGADCVNLRVQLDGTYDFWATSRHLGDADEPGTFRTR